MLTICKQGVKHTFGKYGSFFWYSHILYFPITYCLILKTLLILKILIMQIKGLSTWAMRTGFTGIRFQCGLAWGLAWAPHSMQTMHIACWTRPHALSWSTVTKHSMQLGSRSRSCGGKVVFGSGSRSKVPCEEPHEHTTEQRAYGGDTYLVTSNTHKGHYDFFELVNPFKISTLKHKNYKITPSERVGSHYSPRSSFLQSLSAHYATWNSLKPVYHWKVSVLNQCHKGTSNTRRQVHAKCQGPESTY